MRDPFASYDSWLEAPYQRMYAQGDRIEAAWEALGVEEHELEPPHVVGGPCPRCAAAGALLRESPGFDGDPDGDLYCQECEEVVYPDDKPTFDIGEYIQDQDDAAAEAAAEARAEEY